MKMEENILKKVDEYEYKKGISYATVDSKYYKKINIAFIIVFAYNTIVNLLFVLGYFMFDNPKKSISKGSFYTVFVLAIILVGAFCLTFVKKYIWPYIVSMALTLFSCTGICITTAKCLKGDAHLFTARFYYAHLVPLVIFVGLMLWLGIIALRAYYRKSKTYKLILENIYMQYKNSDGEVNLTEKEWNEILKKI